MKAVTLRANCDPLFSLFMTSFSEANNIYILNFKKELFNHY
ncbi:transcriptional regulator, AraC/XylS family [Oenococcus oeni]|nr:transcriptional regulator, AraC/XylS family [Oenococcus oeni]